MTTNTCLIAGRPVLEAPDPPSEAGAEPLAPSGSPEDFDPLEPFEPDSPDAGVDPEEDVALLTAAFPVGSGEGAGAGSGVLSTGAGGGLASPVEPAFVGTEACATISFKGARVDGSAPTESFRVARPIKIPEQRKASAKAAHASDEDNGSEPKPCSQRRSRSPIKGARSGLSRQVPARVPARSRRAGPRHRGGSDRVSPSRRSSRRGSSASRRSPWRLGRDGGAAQARERVDGRARPCSIRLRSSRAHDVWQALGALLVALPASA